MKLRRLLVVALLGLALGVAACGGDSAAPEASPSPAPSGQEGRVELLGSFPHAGNAWTEGLLVSEGILWESTGLNGKSQVRGLDKQTGAVLWSVPNTEGFFGEGLVRAFGKTYLLTYTGRRRLPLRPRRRAAVHAVRPLRRRGLGTDGDRRVR